MCHRDKIFSLRYVKNYKLYYVQTFDSILRSSMTWTALYLYVGRGQITFCQAAVSNVKNGPSSLITQVFLYISITNSTIMYKYAVACSFVLLSFYSSQVADTIEKQWYSPFILLCLIFTQYHPCRPDEHQVSVLQGLESAGEYIVLQSQIQTGYWTDALQHTTMSCQVSPCNVLYVKWWVFWYDRFCFGWKDLIRPNYDNSFNWNHNIVHLWLLKALSFLTALSIWRLLNKLHLSCADMSSFFPDTCFWMEKDWIFGPSRLAHLFS